MHVSGQKVQDSTLVYMSNAAYDLIQRGDLDAARAVLGSLKVATAAPETKVDTAIRAQALCHLGHIAKQQDRLDDAQTRYEQCAPHLPALTPEEKARHMKSIAAVYGAQGKRCLQADAYVYAAEYSHRMGLDSLARRYDEYAGASRRQCVRGQRPSFKQSDASVEAGCFMVAVIALVIGLFLRPLPVTALKPE